MRLNSGDAGTDSNAAVNVRHGAVARRIRKWNIQQAIVVVLIASLLVCNAAWYSIGRQNDDRYRVLQDDLQFIDSTRLSSAMIEYYDLFRSCYVVEYTSDWSDEAAKQLSADFGADLARHDTGVSQWSIIEEAYFEATGTFSYTDAKTILDFFLNSSGVDSSDSFDIKMDKILFRISETISYSSDIRERFSSPTETIWLRNGDCEDYAMLVSALFEIVGIDSAFTLLWNEKKGNHAVVLIHIDGLDENNLSYYSDLTEFGLSEGRWAFIEPQMTLDMQFDYPGKLEAWTIAAASEL